MNNVSLTPDRQGSDSLAKSVTSSIDDVKGPHFSSTIWLVPSLFLCLTAWAIFIPPTFQRSYIYSWDSAAYIETARSIHAGRGLQQRVIFGVGEDIWQPIAWWPPGYPILIALVQTLGFSPERAGVAIAMFSAAIGVAIIAFICIRLLDRKLAIPVALTTVIMPDFLQISVTCMSDASYFALLAASLACLIFWSTRSNQSWKLLMAAGFFAGAGWAVRNVGLALFAATAIFLISHLFWNPVRQVIKIGATWLAGVAICAVPLIIRNLMTFGGVDSYNMPPSNLSLWSNINKAGEVIIGDITTSVTLADFLVSKYGFLVIGLVALVAVSLWGRQFVLLWRRSFLQQHRLLLLLMSYAVIHISIVIAARTTYRWGELITSRHCVQIYWIFWLCLAIYGPVILHRAGLTDRASKGAIIAVLIIAGSLQIRSQLEFLSQTPGLAPSIHNKVGQEAANYLASNVGEHQIVLSTSADLLRTHCDVNARKIPPVRQYDHLQPLKLEELYRLGEEGFLWGLVIEEVCWAKDGIFDSVVKGLVERPEDYPAFERIHLDSPAVILKYVGIDNLSDDQTEQTDDPLSPKLDGSERRGNKYETELPTVAMQSKPDAHRLRASPLAADFAGISRFRPETLLRTVMCLY